MDKYRVLSRQVPDYRQTGRMIGQDKQSGANLPTWVFRDALVGHVGVALGGHDW